MRSWELQKYAQGVQSPTQPAIFLSSQFIKNVWALKVEEISCSDFVENKMKKLAILKLKPIIILPNHMSKNSKK